MAATVGGGVSSGATAEAQATAAGVVGTAAAWARRTVAREEATEGLQDENSSRQNSGGGAGYYTSGPPSDSLAGGKAGAPPPDVKVIQSLKRQVPFLIDVASSTERLKIMTISAESSQPLSSALARDRQASIDEAAARAAAENVDTVMSKYVNIDTRKIARITSLPPTNPRQTFAAQQLMRSIKQAQSDILMVLRFPLQWKRPKIPSLDPQVGTHPPQSFRTCYQQ